MNLDSAYSGIKKVSIDNDTKEIAHKFSNRVQRGTGYLGYRDLPKIINKHVSGTNALDYGCGAGYSTSLLSSLGLNAVGADISAHMLELARDNYKEIEFLKIELGRLPFSDDTFDLVLSSLVLFDIPSLELVSNYIAEARRVLKPNGVLVALTGSEYFHQNNWLTINNNIEANKDLKSGDTYSVTLIDDAITFHDFFYTDDDYSKVFAKNKMKKLAVHFPTGELSDRINWAKEWVLPPYVIYVYSPEK